MFLIKSGFYVFVPSPAWLWIDEPKSSCFGKFSSEIKNSEGISMGMNQTTCSYSRVSQLGYGAKKRLYNPINSTNKEQVQYGSCLGFLFISICTVP